MDQPTPSKAVRAIEFYRRLAIAPRAADFATAYRQICDLLNQVEDEYTSIPYNPSQWQTDGRMYPPQTDRQSLDPLRADVAVFRSRAHWTRIAANGAIEILDLNGLLVFQKAGADGRLIEEALSS